MTGQLHSEAPSIRDIYPGLSDAELAEAEENLDRYLTVCQDIHDRLRGDPEAHAKFRKLIDENNSSVKDEMKQPEDQR